MLRQNSFAKLFSMFIECEYVTLISSLDIFHIQCYSLKIIVLLWFYNITILYSNGELM